MNLKEKLLKIKLNKKLFLKIHISILIILAVALIILQILGSKSRIGYLSEFDLLETNYNENTTNYSYRFMIRYYDKVFRNSDIYGVYPDLSNLPEFVKEIKMDEAGSPFGNLISTKIINDSEDKIEINYSLSIKFLFYLLYLILIIAMPIVIYLKKLIKNEYIKIFSKNKCIFLTVLSIVFLLFLSIFNFYNLHNSFIDNFIIILFIIISLIYFIFLFVFIKYLYQNKFFKLNKYEIISILVFIAINLFIIFYYMINQRELLIYDPLNYWKDIADCKIYEGYLKNILWNLDYQTFFTIPATILLKIFGSSRLSFTLIIFFLYYLPATLTAAYTVRYMTKKIDIKAPSFILTLAAYFALPIFSINLLNSMHMYGAFIFAYITIIAYFKFLENKDFKFLLIVIPLSLIYMFLWKRWTLYSAIPIVLFISIDILMKSIKSKNIDLLLNLITMGIIGVSFILIFLYPRIIRIISENYSVAYSSYSRDIYTSIKAIVSYFGYISVIIILFSFLFKKIRNISVFLFLSVLIVIYLFLRVQLPHYHQSMTMAHFIFMIFSIFLSYLYSILQNKYNIEPLKYLLGNGIINNKNLLENLVFIIPVIIFIFSYIQSSYNSKLFSVCTLNPRVDNKLDDIIKIYNDLPNDGLIYYANCGSHYGAEISALDTIYFQFKDYFTNLQDKSFWYSSSHIDFRDGVRYDIFSCDYFFASATPHSCEPNQQVTIYPITVFNENLNISKAFRLEDEFKYGYFTNRLYKRVRKNTKEEIYEYVNYFHDYYTNNKMFPKAQDIENILEKYY